MTNSAEQPPKTKLEGTFSIVDSPSPTKEHDDFYKWIGICIKAWARVEERLFQICKTILCCETVYVSIIYYRTPTIDARLSLTAGFVATLFPAKKQANTIIQFL